MKHDLKAFTDADLRKALASTCYSAPFKDECRAEQFSRLPMRWFDIDGYSRGRDGNEAECKREYARTADEAMTQSIRHAAGTRFTPERAIASPHNPKEL